MRNFRSNLDWALEPICLRLVVNRGVDVAPANPLTGRWTDSAVWDPTAAVVDCLWGCENTFR